MTEFRFERKEENVNDYIKTTMFTENPAHKLLIAVMGVCLLAVAVGGIIMFINLKTPSMLIITAIAVVLAAAYPIFLHFFIKSLTKKLTKPTPEENGVTIGISERDILLIRNNMSIGKIEWSEITEISEGKTGFFVTEKGGALIILGKGSVSSGTFEEAAQILNAKKAELAKEK